VNNCAAALVLALNTLADGRDAVISRGELVEIGGSFRVPDIMAKSGARLAEVGTTNRTHLDDYRAAAGPDHRRLREGAPQQLHALGLRRRGRTARARAASARRSGCRSCTTSAAAPPAARRVRARGEPTAGDAVRDGATAVVMSGDKLLGGPQAGIILGAATRSPRCAATRSRARSGWTSSRSPRSVPPWRCTATPRVRCATCRRSRCSRRPRPRCTRAPSASASGSPAAGAAATVDASEATVGGGAFPGARIPSAAVVLTGDAQALERRLRLAPTAVIARVADGRVWLDLRSVPPRHDAAFGDAVLAALG
jgi:L-seryl-tRNA(Ser) seleniumtransferase